MSSIRRHRSDSGRLRESGATISYSLFLFGLWKRGDYSTAVVGLPDNLRLSGVSLRSCGAFLCDVPGFEVFVRNSIHLCEVFGALGIKPGDGIRIERLM